MTVHFDLSVQVQNGARVNTHKHGNNKNKLCTALYFVERVQYTELIWWCFKLEEGGIDCSL